MAHDKKAQFPGSYLGSTLEDWTPAVSLGQGITGTEGQKLQHTSQTPARATT